MTATKNNAVSNKDIWKIALPLFAGRAAEVLAAAADTIFLGRFEGGGLEAIGYATVFLSIVTTFAFGFSKGTQIMIAQSLGDKEKINKLFKNSLVIMLVLSTFLLGIMLFITPSIINSITSSPNVALLSIDYLMVRYWGLPIIFINTLFLALYAANKKADVVLRGTIILIAVNFFFNYVLVFGNFGAPVFGIKGAAIATVIAEVALFFYYIFNLTDLKLITHFKGFIDCLQIKKVVSLSIPLGSRNILSVAGFFAFFWLIEGMEGERSIEVSSVMEKIFAFFVIPVAGFQAATNILVGEQFASKNYENILPLTNKISLVCVSTVGVIVLFSFLFPELLISLFIDEEKSYLVQEAKPIVYILGGACLFIAWEKIVIDTISGMGKTDVSFYIEIIATISYVALAYVFIEIFDLSITWVWSVEIFYAIVLGGVSYLYLHWFLNKISKSV